MRFVVLIAVAVVLVAVADIAYRMFVREPACRWLGVER